MYISLLASAVISSFIYLFVYQSGYSCSTYSRVPLPFSTAVYLYLSLQPCTFTSHYSRVPLPLSTAVYLYLSLQPCTFTSPYSRVPLPLPTTVYLYLSLQPCTFTSPYSRLPLPLPTAVYLYLSLGQGDCGGSRIPVIRLIYYFGLAGKCLENTNIYPKEAERRKMACTLS